MSKLEFVKNYMGEATSLIEYYNKKVKGKHYFLKYHPSTNQGAVIVIDSYSKVLLDAESRICVTFIKNEMQSFFKDEVSDE